MQKGLVVANEIFAHFDGDDIGPALELLLLDGLLEEASRYSQRVADGMQDLGRRVAAIPGVRIVVLGGDDLVAVWPEGSVSFSMIAELQKRFEYLTSRTISIGLGDSAKSALENLHRAKLLGRNRIVSTTGDVE